MARKILLADDSVTAQNMGRKILADAGYEVITVNNGSAALKKIAETKPDLIVLDVYMPGYSGLEVCQRLKEVNETARIPVLLTVGKLEPFKPEEAKRVRAEGFIVKPFEASELLSALTKLEDKIVPRADSSKPGRFARAIAAVEEGRYDKTVPIDEDSGWKSRISFPSKKKGKAAEPEDGDDPAIYNAVNKDLKTVVDHKPSHAPQPVQSHPAQHDPIVNPPVANQPLPSNDEQVDMGALVAHGLPADVTPEEIAALAAAAAQVQGIAEFKKKPEEVSPGQTEAAAPAEEIRVEAKTVEAKTAETPTETTTAEVKTAEMPTEDPVAPAEQTKTDPAAASATPVVEAETKLPADPKSEHKDAVVEPAAGTEKTADEVTTADSRATFASENLEQEKLDRDDSAETHTATPEAAKDQFGEGIAVAAWPAIASFATAAGLPSSSENVISAFEAPKLAEPEPAPMSAVQPAVSRWTAVAVALAAEECSISLEEEMRKAQASASLAAISAEPSPAPVLVETLPAGQLAETTSETPVTDASSATPAPEPISATPAPAVAEPTNASFGSPTTEPPRPDLANEDTQAESATPVVKEFETVTPREPVPSAIAEPPMEGASPAEPIGPVVAEMPAAAAAAEKVPVAEEISADDSNSVSKSAAPASALETVSSPTIEQAVSSNEPTVPLESAAEAVASAPEPGKFPSEKTDPESKTEVAPAIPVAEASETHISQSSMSEKGAFVESAESAEIRSTQETSGGLSDMAKKESDIASTTAAAWASWRRIRQTDSKSPHPENGSAAENASDQAESPRDEAAMAVAAGAEKAPQETVADSETPEIASLVDSVLADLRPKIVEEISRKLGKKK